MNDAPAVEASDAVHQRQGRHTLRDFGFADGAVLGLDIGCWTVGVLDGAGANTTLLSHGSSGNRNWPPSFCQPGGVFDPAGRLIISVDLPGRGASSRASTTPCFPARCALCNLTNTLAGLLDALGAKRSVIFSDVSVSTLVGLNLVALRAELFGAMALWKSGVRCNDRRLYSHRGRARQHTRCLHL